MICAITERYIQCYEGLNVGLERDREQKAFRQWEAHLQRLGDMKDCKSGVAEEYVWGSIIEMKPGLIQFREDFLDYNKNFMI